MSEGLRSPPLLSGSGPQPPRLPARRRPRAAASRLRGEERRSGAGQCRDAHDHGADDNVAPETEEKNADQDPKPHSCVVPAEAALTGCRGGPLLQRLPPGASNLAESHRTWRWRCEGCSRGRWVRNGPLRARTAGGRSLCCRRSDQREGKHDACLRQPQMRGLACHVFPFRSDCFALLAARISAGGAATVQAGKGSVDAVRWRDAGIVRARLGASSS